MSYRPNIAYEQAGLCSNSIIWIFNNLLYFYQAFDSLTPCQTHRQITLPGIASQMLLIMTIHLIHNENVLVIPGLSVKSRIMYTIRWLIVLITFGLSCLLPILYNIVVVLVLILPVVSTFWYKFKFPANYWPLTIIRSGTTLQVGKRNFQFEDLLFLSFKEDEFYSVIRIEAKRKSILFSNEVQLMNNCSGFEEALSYCRQIRNFIDPNLKINYMRRGQGKSVDMGQGSGSLEFEDWVYLD